MALLTPLIAYPAPTSVRSISLPSSVKLPAPRILPHLCRLPLSRDFIGCIGLSSAAEQVLAISSSNTSLRCNRASHGGCEWSSSQYLNASFISMDFHWSFARSPIYPKRLPRLKNSIKRFGFGAFGAAEILDRVGLLLAFDPSIAESISLVARWGLLIETEGLRVFFANSWSEHRGARVLLGAVATAAFRFVISASIQSGRVGDRRGGRSRVLRVFSGACRGRWFPSRACILRLKGRRGSPIATEVLATFSPNSWSVHRGARLLLGAVAPACRLVTSSSTQSGRVGDRRGGRWRALPIVFGAERLGLIILGARILDSEEILWLSTANCLLSPIARFLVAGSALLVSVPVTSSRGLLARSAMARSGIQDEVIPLSSPRFMLWTYRLCGSLCRW